MKFIVIAVAIAKLVFASAAIAGNADSSQKLSQGYDHILPPSSVLVHSKASSTKPSQTKGMVRSLREEWYQDRQGIHWYTWEEKQKQVDGDWIAVGSGIAKQGSDSFKTRH